MSLTAPSLDERLATTPLQERIAEAVASRTTPLSQLLRLVFALEAEPVSGANENLKSHLRQSLRARIGAPLGA